MAVVALIMEASLDGDGDGAAAAGGAEVAGGTVAPVPSVAIGSVNVMVADRLEPACCRAVFSADVKVAAKPSDEMSV